MVLIHLALDRDQMMVLMNMVKNFRFQKEAGSS